MKYMTYDLYARLQSEDETVVEHAEKDWDRACETYKNRIEQIKDKLPEEVLSLLNKYCLHDAKLVTLGKEDNSLSIVVELDAEENEGIRLQYDLIGKAKALFHKENARNVDLVCLYDEIDLVEAIVEDVGLVSVLTHSILFNEGVEVRLQFSGFSLNKHRNVMRSVEDFRHNHSVGRELVLA